MTIASKKIYLVGSAAGLAAAKAGCADGPLLLEKSPYLTDLNQQGLDLNWQAMIETRSDKKGAAALADVVQHCEKLGTAVASLVHDKKFFTVFGGDHSSAIGTWSGVRAGLGTEGDFGLIWVDAHMDSHTPQTSASGNIHGMPVASLLGHGYPQLTELLCAAPKIKPEHICIIGARSYEPGEEELLKRLNVRVYFMDEVKRRGLDEIFAEAKAIVSKGTVAYGITIDIDSIDPADAPGTGYHEPDGLSSKELCQALTQFAGDQRLIGTEIVEFDPSNDINHMTEALVAKLLAALTMGKII